MKVVLKPVALFSLAAAVSLSGWWFADANGGDERTASLLPGVGHPAGLSSRYDLRELDLTSATLHEVEESYVEPQRVDPAVMFDHALDAIERQVPTTLFRREPGSDLLHVQAGNYSDVLELPEPRTAGDLVRALRDVVGVVREHVDPGDIAVDEGQDPWASVEYALINGLLDTLDPHSRLLPPEDSREMDVENSGEFGGLGITIVEREGLLTVDYPLPDTPASNAGLQSDDRILRIDGESTLNMGLEDAVSRLRGRVGSSVRLTIDRDGASEPFDVPIVRDRIKMNPVEGDMLDGGIGIISIKSFHANVAADLESTLVRLAREVPGGRLNGLILDLRGNPGGYLNQAVAVADKFLEDGDIVTTMGRGGRRDEEEKARPARTEPRYPIAVLVNASSASASEIVAGALRNNERAVIIGERSFGKGSVQNLEGFFDGSKLKLTIAKYYTPGPKSIQSVGIPADLELVPAVVQKAEKEGDSDLALVAWRERVRREADLDNRLERQPDFEETPAASVSYLRPKDLRRNGPTLEYLRNDPEVRFARDVLLAAQGRYRRSDLLESVWPVVDRMRKQGERDIVAAFGGIGIDWSEGPSQPAASLEVSLDLGDDNKLVAGDEETLWLQVTNRGDVPLYRLSAVSTSDAEILNGREFVFGRLKPGETARYAQHVVLNEGYATERTPVTLTFRDGGNKELSTWTSSLAVEGRELPRLAWTWHLDDSVGGDGDGLPEAGETVDLVFDVRNVGDGPTAEAFVRAKNASRQALDLERGVLEVGPMVAPSGEACPVLEGGLDGGNVVTGPESAAEATARNLEAGDAPRYADGCTRVLVPGATWTGRLSVKLKDAADAWNVEVSVGDARAYDHTAVMRSGFYRTFTNKQAVLLLPGQRPAARAELVPPLVEISRAPGTVAERDRITLSGRVSDDLGLAHVIVYHNDEKVFFADGEAGLRTVPFTADLTLEPGLNTLVVIATDQDGLTHTRSLVTSWTAPEIQAKADAPGAVDGR